MDKLGLTEISDSSIQHVACLTVQLWQSPWQSSQKSSLWILVMKFGVLWCFYMFLWYSVFLSHSEAEWMCCKKVFWANQMDWQGRWKTRFSRAVALVATADSSIPFSTSALTAGSEGNFWRTDSGNWIMDLGAVRTTSVNCCTSIVALKHKGLVTTDPSHCERFYPWFGAMDHPLASRRKIRSGA